MFPCELQSARTGEWESRAAYDYDLPILMSYFTHWRPTQPTTAPEQEMVIAKDLAEAFEMTRAYHGLPASRPAVREGLPDHVVEALRAALPFSSPRLERVAAALAPLWPANVLTKLQDMNDALYLRLSQEAERTTAWRMEAAQKQETIDRLEEDLQRARQGREANRDEVARLNSALATPVIPPSREQGELYEKVRLLLQDEVTIDENHRLDLLVGTLEKLQLLLAHPAPSPSPSPAMGETPEARELLEAARDSLRIYEEMDPVGGDGDPCAVNVALARLRAIEAYLARPLPSPGTNNEWAERAMERAASNLCQFLMVPQSNPLFQQTINEIKEVLRHAPDAAELARVRAERDEWQADSERLKAREVTLTDRQCLVQMAFTERGFNYESGEGLPELAKRVAGLASAYRARDNIGMSREEYHKAKNALSRLRAIDSALPGVVEALESCSSKPRSRYGIPYQDHFFDKNKISAALTTLKSLQHPAPAKGGEAL